MSIPYKSCTAPITLTCSHVATASQRLKSKVKPSSFPDLGSFYSKNLTTVSDISDNTTKYTQGPKILTFRFLKNYDGKTCNLKIIWNKQWLLKYSIYKMHTHFGTVSLGNCSETSQSSLPLTACKPNPFALWKISLHQMDELHNTK